VKPWVKLHRRVSAKLQKCHPYTRAIAWEILRHADDDGRIPLEGETPVDCICRLLGGDRRMRNAIPGDLSELMRIGMLVVVGDHLVFTSFGAHQGPNETPPKAPQSDVNKTSVERQSSVSPTSVVPQSDVSRASVERQHEPKSPESFNTGPGDKIREEKKRPDEKARARGLGLVMPNPPSMPDMVRLVATRFGERFKAATKSAWLAESAIDAIVAGNPAAPHRDRAEQLEAVAGWAAAQSNPADALEVALSGAFADSWMQSAEYPFGAFAKGIEKYAAAGTKTRRAQQREAKAMELAKRRESEHDAKVARDRAERTEEVPNIAAMLGGIGRRM
jgi:hypothetical protein